jgi:TATA-box binding protein (TBP) (component of TFIID and TFIIIB)
MDKNFMIVNIVAKATLEKEIDLFSLIKAFPKQVRYGPDYYGGRFAHFKFDEMRGRVAVWHSGKMMGMGTTTTNRAIFELRFVANKLNLDFKAQPTISNIVALANIGHRIDLERCIGVIAENKSIQVIYEPEQFPGLIAHLELPDIQRKVSILFFSSGKIIIPGLKSVKEIDIAIKAYEKILKINS